MKGENLFNRKGFAMVFSKAQTGTANADFGNEPRGGKRFKTIPTR